MKMAGFLCLLSFKFIFKKKNMSLSSLWAFKATVGQEQNEECVTSGKSVPRLWEQVAISRQACETFLGRLSRLDRGMEGRRLGAVGSLCLA